MRFEIYHLFNLKFIMRSETKILLKFYKKDAINSFPRAYIRSKLIKKFLVKRPSTSLNCWLYSYRLMSYLHAPKKWNHDEIIKNSEHLHSIASNYQYYLFCFSSKYNQQTTHEQTT